MVAAAAIGSGVVGAAGTAYAANQQSSAADRAAGAQQDAAQAQLAQQNAQFQQIQQLLSPFVQAGTGALGQQQALLGLSGQPAQQAALDSLMRSPQFLSAKTAGENGILENAAATGGLRGGNVERSLSQFDQQTLAQLIQQQFGNLGGLTSIGQNAAAGVGNAGMATGNNITSILGGIGQSQAGNALAQGNANTGYANALSQALGGYFGTLGKTSSMYGTPFTQGLSGSPTGDWVSQG